MRVCAHCREPYPEERPNCPHCGADADLTYSGDEYDPELGLETEDEEYRDFLEKEGLNPKSRGGGCLGAVLVVTGLLVLLV